MKINVTQDLRLVRCVTVSKTAMAYEDELLSYSINHSKIQDRTNLSEHEAYAAEPVHYLIQQLEQKET